MRRLTESPRPVILVGVVERADAGGAACFELVEGGVVVEGVPQGDAVRYEAEGAAEPGR
ncbi:hypothetical protein GCM10022221_31120 [Actinocorallia aurea]